MALSPLLLRCLQPLAATPPLHLALQGLGSSLRSLAGVAGSAEKLEKSFSALREAMVSIAAALPPLVTALGRRLPLLSMVRLYSDRICV